MFDVNIKLYHLQESDPPVYEETPLTAPSTGTDESLSETMDPVQEEDIECYDKKKEAALFLLQLKEKGKIPQSVIDKRCRGYNNSFKEIYSAFKKKGNGISRL